MHHHLEHLSFTLSREPDMNIRTYTSTNGDYVQFEPSAHGPANIYDKEILISMVNQIMHKINRGNKLAQEITFSAYDLLVATSKSTGGDDYKIFKTLSWC